MDEDSMLETPLDKVEPYGMFRDSLLRMSQGDPLRPVCWLTFLLQDFNGNSHLCMIL
jgi:hypothetical protein